MLELEISNQPVSDLKRKVNISKLVVSNNVIEIWGTVKHYKNVNNEYGDHIDKFDINFKKDTQHSWIDLNTGQYTQPTNDDVNNPTFGQGVDPVSELDALKATSEWTAIMALLSNSSTNIDTNGGYNRV